ncbi:MULTISPECIES: GNAT family N-acetyltransferase [Cyanophyceae]|uniref:GNAT family N-acetyltransferase n=1 Tax=Leptolyngbya subtilissima DQ-A4 TaxID=2933933 RepID=A0ABV0JYC4_9CYAN|nr:GNAT family N-acetyltransferase [Nodosilinea sp. FACHB-141]MBD2112074.1 GNAT family N-acetyltransferase [Nodosilinea sp. FACHB-141]
MDSPITIEPAKPEDAQALLEIHAAAVHQTAAPYYSHEILNNWSRRPITSDRIERVRQRWIEHPDRRVIVARHSGQVVGYGFIHKDGELQSLYTHPNYGRRGIGASILATLEREAIALGLTDLRLNASLNAAAFYQKQGFEVIEPGVHQLAFGQEMPCFKMRKALANHKQ